ncbi:MAG: pyruvate ferredoxin oxidoreductase [Deltaproteobacteria bacterium]|nr:pyruvate ferredoxin oxidoreductase [Deltaproteobacteria bacterium]MBW1953595.1 pyruvate ferredoxin oxidoreductase [Deltaproteobacteria bacterium]MBW1986757.1 pyruvate ferredoxin oxidoreductase [Deltaproteobacteria bacterium]MBW2135261.1 pyruvate ferredoxin oxidoreductase [Deltaproteobacteria bacterium]
MAKRVGIEVSLAVSHAVQLARAEAIAAYPITPQTHIVEHLSSLVANAELEAEFINVESEHSAISACIGTSAAGARTYTATSSQGLALMHEILFIASAMRFPIVMTVANRALSGPLSIWNDHSDIMGARDIGWIQVFVQNGQEAFDHTIMAFKIAEHRRVLLPMIVNLDGFILSHVVEALEFTDQDTVDRFLPPYHPWHQLDPKKPVTMGAFGMPEIFAEFKMKHQVTLMNSYDQIMKVWQEWGQLTGRDYHPVEHYKTEGAKILLLTMGCLSEVAEIAVDELRDAGVPVGLLKLRLWRPFPFAALREAVNGAELLIVCDRALSVGGPGGPVLSEVRSVLYPLSPQPKVLGYIIGLGGRDVPPEDFKEIVAQAQAEAELGPRQEFYMYGVRG